MRSLFYDDAPNYDSAKFPTPRPFQSDAHQRLRQGFRDGHRCQMLMSATGSGKTLAGLMVIHEALKKGKRAIFVCDRRSLIEQTSAVADSYGLSAHGVMMANHNRYDPTMPFQIASAQTLARRQWPDADVIVIDEAHTQLKVWTEHIQETRAAVIGLSATPFSAGLGKLFTNLVNATSMHHLTETGVLVPMRVFSCAKVDMRGAETSGGEWTDRAAQERGMAIVGDVVTEWSKFASDRKTIVFGATIAHCEEMARQFNDAGVMAACFTSDTDQAEREMLLSEYRKPDSALRVLISVEALCLDSETEILTRRGWATINDICETDLVASFDIETEAVSFASPIQIIKRPRGPCERMVERDSKFVSIRVTEGHRMIVPRGSRVEGGRPRKWQMRAARDCAGTHGTAVPAAGDAQPESIEAKQEVQSIPLNRRMRANTYALRKAGMSPEDAREEALRRIEQRSSLRHKSPHELSLDECRLIGFWIGDGSRGMLSSGGITYKFAQSMRYSSIVAWFDDLLARLGLAVSRSLIPMDRARKATADVVTWNVPRGTGFGPQVRRGLYALEPYMKKDGDDLFWGLDREQYLALIEGLDKADGIHYRHPSRMDTNPRIANTSRPLVDLLQAIGTCRGCRVSIGHGAGKKGRTKPLYMMTVNASKRYTESALARASMPDDFKDEIVWCVETESGTIVTRRRGRVAIMGNCKGFDRPDVSCVCDVRPLRKSLSTAIQMWGRGLRCSPDTGKKDCYLLDFSGNIIRFADDFSDIFYNGLDDLDCGEKLDKAIRRDEDEKPEGKACPQCGYKPCGKRCVSCGFEHRQKAEIEHEAGEMREVRIGKTKYADDKLHLWEQCCTYARGRSAPEKQRGRASNIYRDITGEWPSRDWDFERTPNVAITRPVLNKIRQKNIAFAAMQNKAAA